MATGINTIVHNFVASIPPSKNPETASIGNVILLACIRIKIDNKKDNMWIYHLNLLLKDIIQTESYNPIDKNSFTEEGNGYYFIYSDNSKLWFGLNYNSIHNDCIMGWIYRDNAPQLFDNIKKNTSPSDENLDDYNYCYKLEKEKYDEFFNASNTKEQQIKILTDFFKDFIRFVKEHGQ